MVETFKKPLKWSREKSCRKFAIMVIVTCLLLYIFLDEFMDNVVSKEAGVVSDLYFVYKKGCHMRAMPVINRHIASFMMHLEDVGCKKKALLRAKVHKGKFYLELNMAVIEAMDYYQLIDFNEVECTYYEVIRKNDTLNKVGWKEQFKLYKNEPKAVKSGINVVRVHCYTIRNETRIFYKDVHFYIPPPPVPEATIESDNTDTSQRISVLIIGIDSVSHLNFLRLMRNTASFVHNNLSHLEFWGYNKVHVNSFPNLMPLLSGYSQEELSKMFERKTKFDKYYFLWQDYKAAGYNTCFGEDTKIIGTFNYNKPGFDKPPTDYYFRPIMVEIHNKARYSNGIISCTGQRSFSEVLWEYVDYLLPHLLTRPFFTFLWWTGGVHEVLTFPEKLDIRFLYMLQKFQKTGLLNKTFVVLMSDHGYRWSDYHNTYQGMREDSLPLLMVMYPKWLTEHYPLAMQNLANNTHSLVTTFDLHETLKDLIDLRSLESANITQRTAALQHQIEQYMPRGVSLFLPTPDERTCAQAGIIPDFCLCKELKEISIYDRRVLLAARFIVRNINKMLQPYPQCHRLRLDRILLAYITVQSKRENINADDIKVILQTTPGMAHFEATVRFTKLNLALAGVITRPNRFVSNPNCIHDYRIEVYCECK